MYTTPISQPDGVNNVSELTERLASELRQSSYRNLEEKIKISRGTLEHLVKGRNEEFPKLETLDKLAAYWKLPMWRVIEMAGIDLGLPQDANEYARQLTALAVRMPEYQPIVQYILKLNPEDVRGVVAYLEVLDRQRNQHDSGS